MDPLKATHLEFPAWTFLTNHAHVLLCIAADPEVRLRDVATRVGITERAVQRIVSDLEEGGYLQREREGRRNHYTVRGDQPLRHPVECHRSVAALISLVGSVDATPPAAPSRAVRPRR